MAAMTTYVGAKRKRKPKPKTPLTGIPGFSKRNKTGGTKHGVASGGGSL